MDDKLLSHKFQAIHFPRVGSYTPLEILRTLYLCDTVKFQILYYFQLKPCLGKLNAGCGDENTEGSFYCISGLLDSVGQVMK